MTMAGDMPPPPLTDATAGATVGATVGANRMDQSVLGTILGSDRWLVPGPADLGQSIKAWARCDGSAEIRALLDHAGDLVLGDRLATALGLLEYAQRKAPSHSLITLFIGDLRLCLDHADAVEPFDLIARRADWRGAWIRLAVSHSRSQDFVRAAADLQETLSRNAPVSSHAFYSLAAKISKMSSAHGWCGVNNGNTLTIGGAAARYRLADLTFQVDGRVVQLTRRERGLRGPVRQFDLTEHRNSRSLRVLAKGLPLIGSPVAVQSIFRVEGFVEAEAGACTGWCWFPGEPDLAPEISLSAVATVPTLPSFQQAAGPVDDSDANAQQLVQSRGFCFTQDQVAAFDGPVMVRGPRGTALYGSPLNPNAEIRSRRRAAQSIASRFPALEPASPCDAGAEMLISIPVDGLRYKLHAPARDPERKTLIVIPVYRGFRSTLDCVHSVLGNKTARERVLVISDASPDPALVKDLKQLARAGDFEFHHEPVNKGFPATANLGLRRAVELNADVVLLNSDTLVTPGWVEILRAVTYASDDIGTATPISNSATIFSYPDVERTNPIPGAEECLDYARHAAQSNRGVCIDVPTGHGFCLYIRLECVSDVGLLREDVFAQGYGEENDFCMRARALGWRSVAAPGAYVGHLEGQSFGAAKTSLVHRNLKILNRLHPGYDKLIAEWQSANPLGPSRRRIDMERWAVAQRGRESILFVTHDREGGVLRHVDHRAAMAEADGFRAIICKPATGPNQAKKCIIDDVDRSFSNLIFEVPSELPLVSELLNDSRLSSVELHHFIGHTPEAIAALTSLSAPYEVHIHDYSWFCPRITLTAERNRYCGEPDLRQCSACVQDRGSNIGHSIEPATLRAQSQSILSSARRVIVPSLDTGRRIANRFGIDPVVTPWEDEGEPLTLKQIAPLRYGERRRVCVVGAIGYEKGYDVILACARLVAEKDLPIDFVVVGFTCDDDRLLRTGRVRITGRYDESEAVGLLKRQNATFGLLPSLWPETWSYTLTQMWQAFLPVITFDIGTPSSRVKARNGGFVLPLGSSTQQIVDALLTLKRTG